MMLEVLLEGEACVVVIADRNDTTVGLKYEVTTRISELVNAANFRVVVVNRTLEAPGVCKNGTDYELLAGRGLGCQHRS